MDVADVEYFGEKWDAPLVDDGVLIDTPVGLLCLYCHEGIRIGDRGLMRFVGSQDEAGKPVAVMLPVHQECDLRMALGSLAHLRGECRCHGRTEPPYPGTLREEALEVLAWLNEERRLQGAGPM